MIRRSLALALTLFGLCTASVEANYGYPQYSTQGAMNQTALKATAYWGASPCGGSATLTWWSVPASPNHYFASWSALNGYDPYAVPWTNTNCSIVFNYAVPFGTYPTFCRAMIQGVGNLLGIRSTDARMPQTTPATCFTPPPGVPYYGTNG